MSTKPGTIVVGIDDSPSASRALAWAVDQAVAERRPLTLVHAISDVSPAWVDQATTNPGQAHEALREEALEILTRARHEALRRAPELEVSELFRIADPREVLLQLSRSAAMVVLGSRGRGRLRSLLLGSVGVALARHASCPVVIHRPGALGAVRDGIVVGADGTEESLSVLEFAYREASLHAQPLTVLHCFYDAQAAITPAHLVDERSHDLDEERLALAESMGGMAEKYPDVLAHTELVRGLPEEAMVRFSDRSNLAVVGAHQDGRTRRMLFGSVSLAVVEHATCPVAVVPLSVR